MANTHRILMKPKGKRPIGSLGVHWRTVDFNKQDMMAWIEII
jgi:hypothetical protein